MTANTITWSLKPFEELSVYELYKLFHLRLEVFAVEQRCSYQDADGKDLTATHLMAFDAKQNLLAYSRLIPAGIAFKEVSIGRVVTSPGSRRTGLGRQLMQNSIGACIKLFGNVPIRIGGQCYLIKFYESYGFVIAGEVYLEDGIEHVEMLYTPGQVAPNQ